MAVKVPRLFYAITVCLGAGLVGSAFTVPNIPTWYVYLNKPFFTPPDWLFGPAWTGLYILIGLCLYLLWQAKPTPRRLIALYLFFIQLGLNVLWSAVFFALHSPLLGLGVIICLLGAILALTKAAWPVSKNAALLLLPYVFWVGLAAVLNFSIVVLN